MSATIPPEKFLRTLAQYLRENEAKFVDIEAERTPSRRQGLNGTGTTRNATEESASSEDSKLLAQLSSVLKIASSGETSQNDGLGVSQPALTMSAESQGDKSRLSSLFSVNNYQLHFLVIQFDSIGLDVGDLSSLQPIDSAHVLVLSQNANAPSDNQSIRSSVSRVSTASFASASNWDYWNSRLFGKQVDQHPIHEEIQYIYGIFRRLKKLRIRGIREQIDASGRKRPQAIGRMIQGFDYERQSIIKLPLSLFASLEELELVQVHPTDFQEWATVQPHLRRVSIRCAGLEDANEIIYDTLSTKHDTSQTPNETVNSPESIPPWPRLSHLALSDNNLTSLSKPTMNALHNLTHLDLSHNLLNDVPAEISELFNLVQLDLSYNMISSVLGIYTVLGNVRVVNLRANRIRSVCGLERVWALEQVDLRDNRISDIAEVGRLTNLPSIESIWVSGNPFASQQYRVPLFSMFAANHHHIYIDGSSPSFLERRSISTGSRGFDATPLAEHTIAANTQPTESPLADSTDPTAIATQGVSVMQVEEPSDSVTPAAEHAESATGLRHKPLQSPTLSIQSASSTSNKTPSMPRKSHKTRAKRVISLQGDEVTSPCQLSKGSPMHRAAQLERTISSEQGSINEGVQHKRTASKSSRPSTPLAAQVDQHRSPSPNTEALRKRIETMKTEAGKNWLTVLGD
ncbi:hypothetical protein BZG36_02631, partial [Bifiguratus adelaidae]